MAVAPVKKAVFPVAGLGTRFLPATKVMPKEMLTVVDKPLIQYAVEEAAAAGIEEFIFVTSRGKGILEDHFDQSPELMAALTDKGKDEMAADLKSWLPAAGKVISVRQPEPLGLGHAVWCARHVVGDAPFAVLLVDDLIHAAPSCMAQMIAAYEQLGENLVLVEEVPPAQTNRYGILDIAEDQGDFVKVKGFVEKPEPEDAPSNLSIIGRYIFQPQIFDFLAQQGKGAGGEIQLTDAMASMLSTQQFHGVRYQGERFDCGDKLGFLQANVALGLARPEFSTPLRAFLDARLKADGGI